MLDPHDILDAQEGLNLYEEKTMAQKTFICFYALPVQNARGTLSIRTMYRRFVTDHPVDAARGMFELIALHAGMNDQLTFSADFDTPGRVEIQIGPERSMYDADHRRLIRAHHVMIESFGMISVYDAGDEAAEQMMRVACDDRQEMREAVKAQVLRGVFVPEHQLPF